MTPEASPEYKKCPYKVALIKQQERAHNQASVSFPSHDMDDSCEFGCGPEIMRVPKWAVLSNLAGKAIGPLKEVEVCCWRPSETPVELP
jgi:hypothetical protein